LSFPGQPEHVILQTLVDDRLVVQAGTRNGLVVSDEDVDKAIADVASQNKMEVSALAPLLAKQDYTLAEYREEVRRQILQLRAATVLVKNFHLAKSDAERQEMVRAWVASLREQAHVRILLRGKR
jgi:peptidyl-prolyl cis-trans isomerase SurA